MPCGARLYIWSLKEPYSCAWLTSMMLNASALRACGDATRPRSGREITIGLTTLRARTLEYLRRADPFLEIEWQDCLEVCTMSPRLLYGDDKKEGAL